MGPSADGVITNPTPAVLLWEAGCSRREPGLTPAADLSIPQWNTFTELKSVHFEPSTRQGTLLGRRIGKMCHERLVKLMAGEA